MSFVIRPDRNPTRKTRVYVSNEFQFKDELKAVADKVGAPSIYTPIGDYPELDNAWKKVNRMEVKEMREKALKEMNANGVEFDKMRFSRKAGCSCGCSPGFILEGHVGYNIWVD